MYRKNTHAHPVCFARLDDTIGGEDHGSGELGKLLLLVLPAAAEVASKILKFQSHSDAIVEKQHETGRSHNKLFPFHMRVTGGDSAKPP